MPEQTCQCTHAFSIHRLNRQIGNRNECWATDLVRSQIDGKHRTCQCRQFRPRAPGGQPPMSDQAMVAGPEMDAEVARAVFGHKVLGMAACQSDPECCRCVDLAWSQSEDRETFERPVMLDPKVATTEIAPGVCCCTAFERYDFDGGDVLGHHRHCPRLETVPRYSEDIAAAWTVAERLRDLGLEVIIGSEPDGWEVEVVVTKALFEQGYRGIYSKHGALPISLCRAAIHALRTADPEARRSAGAGEGAE